MSVINDTLLLIKGVLNAGINLVNGASAVSPRNPLPVAQNLVGFTEALKGNCFAVTKLTHAAASIGAGKNGVIQLWNPSSDAVISVFSLTCWGTASTTYRVNRTTTQRPTAVTVTPKNQLSGSNKTCAVEVYTDIPASISATGDFFDATISSTAPAGTSIRGSSEIILLPNSGIDIECATQNLTTNIAFNLMQLDYSDLVANGLI